MIEDRGYMQKEFNKLILDEKKKLIDVYKLAKNEIQLCDIANEELLDSLLADNKTISRLRAVFKNRNPGTLNSIFEVLRVHKLDNLVYVEYHTGHRSNEI